MPNPRPTRRLSFARTGILVGITILAVLAFSPIGGPLRILFRGVLVIGVVALVGSYLWPAIQRLVRPSGPGSDRREPRD